METEAIPAIYIFGLVLTALGGAIGAYIQSRVAKRNTPENRDAIIQETTERIQSMFSGCIEKLQVALEEGERLRNRLNEALLSNAELKARMVGHEIRIMELEQEVIRLGGDPTKLGQRLNIERTSINNG